MQDKLEGLIKTVYRKWKTDNLYPKSQHPDEETIACFLENKLSEKEIRMLKEHIVNCNLCSEIIATQITFKPDIERNVPAELLNKVKGLVVQEEKIFGLEIILRLKEKALEVLHTTGDILFGQELIPVPVLRSRGIKDFKDEVTILKDFAGIRVEVKIESRQKEAFTLTVLAREKSTQKIIKDLRISLIRNAIELESYLTDSGRVTFEHVLLGKYTIELSTQEAKLASVLIEIKK